MLSCKANYIQNKYLWQIKNIKMLNGIVAALNHTHGILIKFDNETLLSLNSQDIQEKEIFNNGLGEHVIELSGLSSKDARLDRSWAYVFY